MNIKLILLTSLIAFPTYSQDKIRIGIIDTGNIYNSTYGCDSSLDKDFTHSGSMRDDDMHGSIINEILTNNLDFKKYCIINIKFYSSNKKTNKQIVINSLQYAKTLNLSYLNLSWGGPLYMGEEHTILKYLVNNNVKIFTAAGNESKYLDKGCNYFPACYNDLNVFVVGSVKLDGSLGEHSNYGPIVKFWEIGEYNKYGLMFKGTSFAVPKAIRRMIDVK